MAQQKVGTTGGDPVSSYYTAFYSLAFLNGPSYARGGDGVVTGTGLLALHANPAGVTSCRPGQFLLEGQFFRNSLEVPGPVYRPAYPHYTSASSRFQSLGTVMYDSDRLSVAFGVGAIRNYEWADADSFEEITEQGPTGKMLAYSTRQKLTVSQYELAFAYRLSPSHAIGAAIDIVDHEIGYHYAETTELCQTNLDDHFIVVTPRIGWQLRTRDLSLGASARLGQAFHVAYKNSCAVNEDRFTSELPTELAAGAMFRQLLSCEFKFHQFRKVEAGADFYQVGGGMRVPVTGSPKRLRLALSFGVLYRQNMELYENSMEQTFLNTGIDASYRDWRIQITGVNGHSLNNANRRVSQVIVTFGRFVS